MTKPGEKFDIVFVGKTSASLIAAACVKKLGSTACIISVGDDTRGLPSIDCPPNFVWRLLDLSERNLELEPIDRIVSSDSTQSYFTIYENEEETIQSLISRDLSAAEIWRDFLHACKKDRTLETLAHDRAIFRDICAESGHHNSLLMSANEVLDSYFENEEIKAHIAGISLMQFGLSGDEPGSAIALCNGLANATWRMKPKQGIRALESSFARICDELDVDVTAGRIFEIDLSTDNIAKLQLEDDITLIASNVVVADNSFASKLGIFVNASGSPLGNVGSAKANVEITFSRHVEVFSGGDDGLHFSSPDGRASLQMAKDAAVEGRISETPPIFFEAAGRTVNVVVPYLPSRISTESEWRDWTGQDKQALGAQILDQVAPYIKGGRSQVLKVDVSVSVPKERVMGRPKLFDDPRILMPAPHHNQIEALVSLAMRILGHE